MKINHRKKYIYAKIPEKYIETLTKQHANHLSTMIGTEKFYIIFLKPDTTETRVYVSHSWNDSSISEKINNEELSEYVTSAHRLIKSHLRNEDFEIGVGFFNFNISVDDAYGDIDDYRKNTIIDGLTIYDSKLLGLEDLKLARELSKK